MSTNGSTPRAILYARVSSDDRGKDGRNLAGQIEMCREYAEEHGWQIVAELKEDDRGASGAALDLPMLTQALEMAAGGKYDVLVTREIDRFARKLAKQLVVEQELRRNGVTIEYVLGDYPETPEGQLMKHVRAVIAEYEREKIKERMARGRRLKVKGGSLITHGLVPYGYHKVEDGNRVGLEVDEETAPIVRMIFEWYAEGVGVTEIVERLGEMGIPTPSEKRDDKHPTKKRGRTEWARSTVYLILRTETYAGLWHYGKRNSNGHNGKDDWLSVEVPSIISRDLWEHVQERRKHNRKHAPSRAKYDYLLSGRLTCRECGASMAAVSTKSKGRVYLYYRCPAKPCKMARECSSPTCRADHLDATVWRWVKRLLSKPEEIPDGLEAMRAEQRAANQPIRERLAVIDGLLEEQQEQLERWLDLYLSGDMPKEMLTERRQRLEDTIEALQQERDEREAELSARSLTAEEAANIATVARRLAQGFEEAEEEDFESQRWMLDKLRLSARFYVTPEGKKRVQAECILDEEDLLVASSKTNSTTRRTCPWKQ